MTQEKTTFRRITVKSDAASRIRRALVSATLVAATPGLLAQSQKPCADLAATALPDTTITTGVQVEAGTFDPGANGGPGARSRDAYKKLPAFCRVAATIRPSSDSEIKMEVWMPASGWNGRLQVVGNGGWVGSISYPSMAKALASGYATASTNTGHDGDRASFAVGHPEKLTDFAWRAVHLTTVQSKAIVKSFYGNSAKYTYWNGCSSGGKQGLKEAQKFPDDFDGLVTGAAAANWNNQKAAFAARFQAMRKPEGIIPKEKYAMIHNAVLNACDALDGVKDGVLENPMECHFDPASIQCKAEDGPSCLTAPQVASMHAMYDPVRSPKTGAIIFSGIERGTEMFLDTIAGDEPRLTQTDLFTFVVYNDPKWDPMTSDIDVDLAAAEKADAPFGVAAMDPNLKPLFAHSGKLLMYHGFADPNIMPENSLNYYKSVISASGGPEKTKDSIKLFMVPGMGHCGGGDGPNEFDMMPAITAWVEKGQVPDRIIASRINNGTVTRTRPLCAYPEVAKYKGTGSTDDALNFVCKAN